MIFLAQDTPAPVQGFVKWLQPMLDQFTKMGESFAGYVPKLLLGLVVIGAGLLFAKLIRFLIFSLGEKLKLDALSEKIGISGLLERFGLRTPASKVLGSVVFWIIVLYFLKAAADILGIKDISTFVNAVIAYLPKLFVSILILLAGLLAADLVRGLVRTGLDEVGIEYSGLIAKFVYILLSVMILTVVLGQLGIQTELINASVKIILGAIGLAVALAMGFGLRPVARNVVSGVYARDIYTPGSVLTIDEVEATVVEVGPVATRLEVGEGRFLVVPNARLVSQVTKGKHKVSGLPEKNSF